MSRCPACDSAAHTGAYLGEGVWEMFRFRYRACRSCGTIFVDPMPPPELLDRLYGPAYLDAHYTEDTARAELIAERDAAARAIALRRPGARLLDVGCGRGGFLDRGRALGLDVEGIERVAETAAQTAHATGLRIHAGALDQLAASTQRYDVVHFADVLEHHPAPIELLIAARTLLVADGIVVARGPLQNQRTLFRGVLELKCRAEALARRREPHRTPPTHVLLFTRAGWRALLQRAGLACVDERLYEVLWPAPERAALEAKWLLKASSRRLSRSLLGKWIELGDRVVSWCRPVPQK